MPLIASLLLFLISYTFLCNSVKFFSQVVLHTALHDFNKDIIVAIIKHGADVHIQDRNGNNIILQIINNPDFGEPFVLALIKVIFDELDDQRIQTLINDETKSFNADGYSVIHEVVRKNYMQVLKYLRESATLILNAVVSVNDLFDHPSIVSVLPFVRWF